MLENIHIDIECANCLGTPTDNVISIVNLIASIIMVIVSVLGVVCVFSYRQHQKEAAYGFYANIQTFLVGFQLYIHSSTEEPLPWMRILGKKNEDIDQNERDLIAPVVEFSKAFFTFLSTATNQIPPTRNKNEISQWDNSFCTLRTRLVDIANYDLQAYPDWDDSNISATCIGLNEAVDNIINLIKKHSNR